MKNSIIIGLMSLFMASTLSATTTIDKETRDLDRFSQVSVATGINLILVKGNTHRAEIEADNIELDKISTEVSGSKLIIKIKDNNKWGWNWGKKIRNKVNVTLTFTELEQVSASSGASVTSQDVLSNDDLEFDASSGASIELEIEGRNVEADASSGSDIILAGECDSFDASVSSGATIKGSDLEASSVEAKASSGASIRVWVKDELYAKASSGGSIKYKGNPKEISRKKSSGGSVKQL